MHPVDEVDPHIDTSAVDVDRPFMVGDLFRVNSDANALTAENIRAVPDKLRIFHRLRIYGNLVRSGSQGLTNVVNRLIPPPTVSGTNTFLAVSLTTSRKTPLPSNDAVIS